MNGYVVKCTGTTEYETAPGDASTSSEGLTEAPFVEGVRLMANSTSSSHPESILSYPLSSSHGSFIESCVTADGGILATWLSPSGRVWLVDPTRTDGVAIDLDELDLTGVAELLEETARFLRKMNSDEGGSDV